MKFTRHFANLLTSRRLQSLACLLAALLLQSPVVAAAALASGACCAGDHCPIAAHHHAASKESPMHCDHGMKQSADKVGSCSMSCCDNAEPYAVHANLFLLAPVIEVTASDPFCESIPAFDAREAAVFFAPLSPPPESRQASSEPLPFA